MESLSPTLKQGHFRIPKDWNSIIKHQTKLKNDDAILSTYTQMESLGVAPDSSTMPLVLKACTRLNAIEKGKQIHFRIRGSDLIQDVRVGTALVDFYCKCGFIKEAREVFDELFTRDVVSWNALISGYVGCSFHKEAISLFVDMQNAGFKPNSRTLVALLLACEAEEVLELRRGQEIHGYCLRNGLFDFNAHVGTALIGFYMGYDPIFSHQVFNMMVVKNVVSWNAIITGYLDISDYQNALKLFICMLIDGIKFDAVTMLVAIQACSESESLQLGMQLHQLAIKLNLISDLFIANALLNMYSDNGNLESSCALFNDVPSSDAALWNSMISAYIAFGLYAEAIALFVKMRSQGVREDDRTVVMMLSICEDLNCLEQGRGLHAYAMKVGLKLELPLGNALLSMYIKHNQIDATQKVFYQMRVLDVVSWNLLILAFSQSKFQAKAVDLFEMMCKSETKINSYTMISLLTSCKDENDIMVGRSVHGFAIKNSIEINTSLNTALTEMYINCGDEGSAGNLFSRCQNRDLISWNSLLSSYIKNNNADKAIILFKQMIYELEPNSVTILNVLTSCTQLAHLPLGQSLHGYISRKYSLESNPSLANAFITMYARCGKMEYAERIFNNLQVRNIVSWNAILTGYGMQGRGYDAIQAFSHMLNEGFKPSNVTFVSVLSACSHSGLIETGLELFKSMVNDFDITPELTHYGCLVDLLGRGGHVAEAIAIINSMPIKPDGSVWRALLSACQIKNEKKLVENIFGKLVELEPNNPGNYVLLSNIYAAAGLWSEVAQIRKWLRDTGLGKPPGTSWIVIEGQVHNFTSTDASHPQTEEIYANLNSLTSLTKRHWL